VDVDLTGIVDLHLHSAPDTRPRVYDDIELARVCREAGLRAILIKSHVTITADRATIAEKVVPGIRVFGALALNKAVGGLNPAAVEAAIKLGAKQIWMPTSSAARHIAFYRWMDPSHVSPTEQGITILQENGALAPAVHDILNLVARADVILGTGHLSPSEVARLVPAAHAAGVHRIIVTHPELMISDVPLAMQQELALPGVWFERCFVATVFEAPTPLDVIAAGIAALGPERTILSSDLGLAGKPEPVGGWRTYLAGLLKLGTSWRDLELMTKKNPAELVGL
jgi:Family of unknown function (DUF6282)